jgi:Transposase IS66 family
VLKLRSPDLPPIIQVCDALSHNVPKLVDTLVANCNAHGRRNFVKVIANFPEPCRFVLETFREIYGYDAVAREQRMSAEERLAFHQEHSKPVMDKLHSWLEAQFQERTVEPNSGLGQAISYLLKHWHKLTLFLEKAGVPLDNNLVTAVSGSGDVMPIPGLCRVGLLVYSLREGSLMFVAAVVGIITSSPERPARCLEAGSGQAQVWMGWRVPMLVP